MNNDDNNGSSNGARQLPYPECWGDSYLKYIQSYHNNGSGVKRYNKFIISNEILAGTFGKFNKYTCSLVFNSMLSSLGSINGNNNNNGNGNATIEIVYTQRPFFDYLLSMHSQEYDGGKFQTKPKLKQWKGGINTPNLIDYVAQKMKGDYEGFSKAIKCFQHASNTTTNVNFRMIDYNESNVAQSFFQILTGDNEQLASNLMRGTSQKRENVASSKPKLIPADRIAMAAYKAGGRVPLDHSTGIEKPIGRFKVRTAIKQLLDDDTRKFNSSSQSIIYNCPDNDAKPTLELLELSIQLQTLAFPNRNKSDIREEVSKSFQSMIDSKRLCDVDGGAMINDPTFRTLLMEKLHNKKKAMLVRNTP